MAQKSGLDNSVVICFLAFAHETVEVAELSVKTFTIKKESIKKLDLDLLPLLDHILSGKELIGIGMNVSHLGGFVSSRIMMNTANMMAWLKGISVVPIVDAIRHEHALQRDLFTSMQGSTFSKQLITTYSSPPDITQRKKRPRFTIQ